MPNLPSHEQLQDDPFGFRDEYRDSAKPEDPGFMDTAFPTPSEYGAQVRQYDAGRPTARSEGEMGTRVVQRGGQVFDPSFDAKRNNLARGRSPLPAKADPIDPVTLPTARSPLSIDPPPQAQPSQRSTDAFGASSAKTQLQPQFVDTEARVMAENQSAAWGNPSVLPADKIAARPTPTQMSRQMDSTRASAAGVDARNNAQMQALDPAKTIAKGRTLGPGLTISQTESGEVAAFGPDGQVVNLKDQGVRSRFNLPTTDAPKTANPGTVLSESRPSPITRKQMDVYNTDRANGYTGSRDYISPFLSPDQQRERQNEIYAQRQADREAIAQRLATENTIADLESQRTGVPTTSARNRSMLPTSERVMGERQDRMAHERVSEQRNYNMMAAKQAAEEKDASLRDSTTRRGQDIDAENSRRAAQDNAENRKSAERVAQIQYGSKTQRDYQREAMLRARSEAINAALSSDPKSVESPAFQKWLDDTYPLMTPEERLELEKQGAAAPDPKQYK